MAEKGLVKSESYKRLAAKVKAEFDGLELLVKQETVLRYWRAGGYICEHLLKNKERARYGKYLYDDLSEDTGRSKSTLRLASQLYRTYPIIQRAGELSLRHYQALLAVEDIPKRKQLEKQVIEKCWTSEQLRGYVSRLQQKKQASIRPKIIPALSFTKGKLNTFRLLESQSLPSGGETGILIDCGFGARAPLAGLASDLQPGECIEAVYKAEAYSINRVTADEDELFTYQASVVKISDGDTLWAFINPGFGVCIEQNLRLRGIDSPELSTKTGQKAKQFVGSRLKGLDFMIIKTYRDQTGKYGRYLADIFYLRGESDPQIVLECGTFLNQELMDMGLAVLI